MFFWFMMYIQTFYFSLGPALPPIDALTVTSLMLHSKKITLAPFPEELDELMYAPPCLQSSLVTLKYASKYFIPSRSFVM